MSDVLLEPGTGRAGLEQTLVSWRHWLQDRSTGWEFIGASWTAFEVRAALGGLREEEIEGPALIELTAPGEASLVGRAATLAAETPYITSPPPPVPQLSGNLAEDVRNVCGLTWAQIAVVFGISERAAAGWRTQGVPQHRAKTMEALRAIGATLVGGLGPAGVGAWLTAGHPSRLERLRDGEQADIAAEALSYRDTPAT